LCGLDDATPWLTLNTLGVTPTDAFAAAFAPNANTEDHVVLAAV
jgi:hypothetical protein